MTKPVFQSFSISYFVLLPAALKSILSPFVSLSRVLLHGVSLIPDTLHHLRRLLRSPVSGQTSAQPPCPHIRHLALHARQRRGRRRVQRPGNFHPGGHAAVGRAAARPRHPHHGGPLPLQYQLPAVGDPGRAARGREVPVHGRPVEEELRQQLEQSGQPHLQPARHQRPTAR